MTIVHCSAFLVSIEWSRMSLRLSMVIRSNAHGALADSSFVRPCERPAIDREMEAIKFVGERVRWQAGRQEGRQTTKANERAERVVRV